MPIRGRRSAHAMIRNRRVARTLNVAAAAVVVAKASANRGGKAGWSPKIVSPGTLTPSHRVHVVSKSRIVRTPDVAGILVSIAKLRTYCEEGFGLRAGGSLGIVLLARPGCSNIG